MLSKRGPNFDRYEPWKALYALWDRMSDAIFVNALIMLLSLIMKPVDLLPSLPIDAKILFVRLRSLGDTVLSTPLYRALKTWRPDLRLSVLLESPHDEVLQSSSELDRVIRIQRCKFPKAMKVRWSALKEVRRNRFDCCVNLHGGSTGAWFTLLSGAPFRVGLEGFRNQFAYNVLSMVPPRKSDGSKMHTVEYQIRWLRQLGLPESPIPPLKVETDPMAKLRVMDKLVGAGLRADFPYAVIQPASKLRTKEWPPEGFAEIVNYLSQSHHLQSVLIGGPEETPQVEAVAERCQIPAIVISGISVSELMSVIQGATIFVGNDSGPTHIASALQVPVVVIFGSSDSEVWFPWQATSRVVQNDFDCNPCPGHRCLVYHQPRCILSITPSQVKAAIDSLLQRRLEDKPLRI